MRGVCRSEPKYLAVSSSLNAKCFSVRTKNPSHVSQFECDVLCCQNHISLRRFPIWMRGVCLSEPKFLAGSPSVNSRFFSVGAKIPGRDCRFECEVLFSQNRNSWRSLPIRMRCVCRSGPKFLAMFNSLNARCFSVRTAIPGGIPQFKCEGLSVRAAVPGCISQC